LRKDGSCFLADVVIDALKDGRLIGFAKITRDVTERVQAAQARIGLVQSRAEEALRRVQAELAHVARVTTLGELTASIAHELNQPIGSTLLDTQAALHWLAAQPPDLDEVRQSLVNIIAAAKRAGDITGRYRDLIKNVWPAPSARGFDRERRLISLLQRIRLRRSPPSQDRDTRAPVLTKLPASWSGPLGADNRARKN
jgi:C4-dicarboxylate-specific signal transduction histidine kinase